MDAPGRGPGAIRAVVGASAARLAISLRDELAGLGYTVLAAESDASSAVAAAVAGNAALCVLTADLPGSAVLATAEITAALPEARVVILADTVDEDDCLTYLLAGASGYLEHDSEDAPPLRAALRDAVAGEVVLPRAVGQRLLEALRNDSR